MKRLEFQISRGERFVLAILLVLAMLGLGLYQSIDSEALESKEHATTAPLDTIYSPSYVGPPSSMRPSSTAKFKTKTILDLNRVDSLTLLRVPGIGPTFAGRILGLRTRLGGYYTVLQLQEVYGMDEEKFLALRSWFAIRSKVQTYLLDSLKADELPSHPYLSSSQRKAMNRLLYRKGHIRSWTELMQTKAFSRDDSIRLSPYFVEHQPDKAEE